MKIRRLTLAAAAAAAALAACGGPDVAATSGGSAGTKTSCPTGSALSYQSFGQGFLTTYCTSCHSGASPSGGHDWTSIEQVRANATRIDQVAGSGPGGTFTLMPPAGSPAPSTAERAQLSQWLACGAL